MANAYNEKTIKNDTDYVLVTESTGGIFRVSLLDLIGDLASNENVTMIQMALANKWGVEIAEDVAGRKYASGFSLLLHPIWLNGQAYTVGDTVAVDASVYRCIFNHTANSVNSPTSVNAAIFWLLLPEGVKSSFIVRADQFAVMGPDGSGDALMPFTVDIVDGQAIVGIHGQLIVGGSLPFNALSDEAQTTINNSISTAEAQALSDAKFYADNQFVTQVLHQEDIDNLQSQMDGQVVAWFYDYEPTTANTPASLWTTEALQDQHANDTFTHLITGQSWRWVYDAGAWKWLEIVDTATTAALALASKAKDTADNKRRVFTAQPAVPYDEGDLWADGTTLLRCVTPKTSAGIYVAGDWVAVATKAPQLPPDDDLFAHWDFDDTLLDRVSLLTPTQYGTGGFVGGISGRGQNFVYATKDYLKLPAGAMASIANGTGFTLSLWFKADSDQMYENPRLFTIAETNLNFTLGLQGTAPAPLYPVVRYAGAVKYSPATPVSQGEWHHIVVRVNSLTAMDITLWLDGVLCTDWVTGGISGNAAFNALGAYDGTGYGWTGAIDEVRVYNTKAITDDHVRALYLNPGGSSKNVAPDVDKTDYETIYINTETFPAVVTPAVMKRTGSAFEKTSDATGWVAQAYSSQRYTGGCRLAFKTGTPNKSFMMGIAFDPTLSTGYTSTDYQFYLRSDATAVVYEKATQRDIGNPVFTTDTLFEIIYDGSEVRYLMDGVVVRTVTGLDFNLSFCLDSSFYSVGAKATHVQWGPYSPPLSVVQARAELARTTAQAYADGEITAAEQRAIAEAQTKADLAETNANAYADGKVTAAEQRAIDAAQAKATLAETNAKAWADGLVTAEEARAIQDAKAKADAAELAAKEYADVIVLSAEQRAALDAQAKATAAETTAKAYANDEVTAAEQRAIADAQSKALMGHNLLNWYESWVPGTGSTGQFIRSSTDAENMRALATGPFGQREIVWQSIPSGDGTADGGFNTLAPTGGFSVDPDKTYIYGCYIQRLTGNGTLYFGCSPVKDLSDAVNSNPYFVVASLLNSAKWVLAIGVIHPRGYTGPATGMSGFYDVETGVKFVAGSDFKIDDTLADPSVQRMRAYQFYSTTGDGVTVETQFARPFVMEASVCPPIDQLTGKLSTIAAGADVTDYRTIYANTETFPAVLTPDVMKRTGSTFEKVGGVATWNAQAYSLQGYTGGCRLAFKAGGTTLNFMAGINTDPATDASYSSVDYQFQCQTTGLVTTYQGVGHFGIGDPSYTTDTLFEIIYNGSEIRFLMDGVTKRTVTGLDAGLTFYMDLSFASVGSKATHVQWGPYAPPLSVVKALALAAETEAKSFADGIVTAEEQRAIADAQAKANAAQAAAEGNSETFPVAITPDLMIRRGSTFEKTGGVAGWNAQAYSVNKYTGGCRVAFRAGSVDKAMALGINRDPALDTSYTSIDYSFHLQGNATVIIYESGAAQSIGAPPYTTNTLFEITYNGAEVRYLIDGVAVRTVTGLASSLAFYMDSAFHMVGCKVTHVEWGPYGPTLSVAQTLASTAEANAKSYVDGNFVTKVLHQTDIGNLQNQVDGQISAWFYSYVPTTANAPASSWTTAALKEQHANDTFTHLTTGQSWRWVNTAGVWGWTEIADTATVKALAEARVAQDTADNKRRVFVNQPTVPYDIGDLWTTGSIISRCVTAKTTAGSYAAGDWVAVADATNYNDYRVSNVKTENSVTTIARPVGGTYYNSGASVTGAIKITLPQSWSNTMMKLEVDVRQYNSTQSFTLQLGGYTQLAYLRWLNSFAQLTGSTASNNRVRFGHDGTKCCILIGDVTSVWNYPSIVVKDFQASYSTYTRDKWETGWAISLVTDISGITTTADITDTLIDAKSILGQGALATQSTADYGTQVTGTKPPANADSTTTVIGAGLITTGFIGNKLKTDPLLTLGINFDTAEILVGAAAGLKIKSGGGILVEGGGALSLDSGGDIILTADSTNPSEIQFKKSPTDTSPVVISGNIDTDLYAGISIMPSGPNVSKISIGEISRRFNLISMAARSIDIGVSPEAGRPVGFRASNDYANYNGYAEVQAYGVDQTASTVIFGRCRCTTADLLGVAKLESSDSTRVASNNEVTISAPDIIIGGSDITITGSTVKGVPIYAPYRTTTPTTAELPNNHYMIYRTSATGIRLTMNCDGNIQTRSIL